MPEKSSTENIVEALVVLDKRVIELHGRDYVETYILTIMNIVSKSGFTLVNFFYAQNS